MQVPSQLRTFAKSCYDQDHVKTADGGRILRPWEEAFGLTEEQYDKNGRQEKKVTNQSDRTIYRKNEIILIGA
jgi:hypothetical protein